MTNHPRRCHPSRAHTYLCGVYPCPHRCTLPVLRECGVRSRRRKTRAYSVERPGGARWRGRHLRARRSSSREREVGEAPVTYRRIPSVRAAAGARIGPPGAVARGVHGQTCGVTRLQKLDSFRKRGERRDTGSGEVDPAWACRFASDMLVSAFLSFVMMVLRCCVALYG
jgi:hypothetical protein